MLTLLSEIKQMLWILKSGLRIPTLKKYMRSQIAWFEWTFDKEKRTLHIDDTSENIEKRIDDEINRDLFIFEVIYILKDNGFDTSVIDDKVEMRKLSNISEEQIEKLHNLLCGNKDLYNSLHNKC